MSTPVSPLFMLMGNKIITILRSKFCLSGSMAIDNVCFFLLAMLPIIRPEPFTPPPPPPFLLCLWRGWVDVQAYLRTC